MCSLVGAQVLERWLTCFCWHVTWNLWIVSIEIVRKCLFNTCFSSFYFHLYLLRNSKVLFAGAQVCEPLIDCVWHVNFGWLSTNNPKWLQYVSSNICKKIASSHFSFCGFVVQLLFAGAQHREVCDPLISCVWHVNFGWLSSNNPTWLQRVSSIICNFFDSFCYSFHSFHVQLFLVGTQVCEVCEPLMYCVLACSFRVAINGLSDMTTVCKFQYFQKKCLLSLLFLHLRYVSLLLSVLSAARYATH